MVAAIWAVFIAIVLAGLCTLAAPYRFRELVIVVFRHRSPDIIQLPSAVCALPVPLPLLVSRRIVADLAAEAAVIGVYRR